MGIILVVYLSYKIYMKAEQKGLAGWLWFIYNFIAWLVGEFIGKIGYSKIFNVNIDTDILLKSKPLDYFLFEIFILLTGLLGYALVDRKLNGYPDAK